ncbi:unnamed protein product [Somion occarium]|uniref:G3BP-like protein n=1 Tax=Somion occarium TaxID=3059160 RepID=A0ABP1CXH2_9APHY
MTNTSVNPSEVGWQFVPQYYTFVNKQPHRLHCFYTKASTFIHGTEGEDGKPCFGQQEIHAKITSIGFQDCKVFIHSVDAQSSANGGIIIQVIGEMSNNGEPWRKFVQTFFLAEQPNGYFVLNDIFRFLKEESVDDDQASDFGGSQVQEQPTVQVQEPAPPAPSTPAPPAPPPVEPEPEPAPVPAPTPPVVEEVPAPEPEPQPQPNGIHEHEAESAPEPEPAAPSAPEPVATASPPPVSPVIAPQTLAPSPAPAAQQPPQPHAPQPAPVSEPVPPTPSAPPKPKSWASLAAAGSNKWGSVAQETRGISEVPAASSSPGPPSGPQSPAPHARPAGQTQPPALQAASSVTTAQCFVKGVTEHVSEAALRSTLQQRFGPLKNLEVVPSKACAFFEFNTVDAARRAIIASLPPNQGGEGGIRIGNPQDSHAHRVVVETRKERGERPPPRGPPVNGGDSRRGGGGFRGRGAPGGGRGRGAGPQK